MTLIRKPLLLLLVLAGAASLAASGRFSLRLLFDTAIVLSPLPLIQVLAFALVYVTGRRPLPFAPAVDAFFSGNGPWFLALAAVGLFGAVVSPVVAARWFGRVGLGCGVAALLASLRLDFRYFIGVLERSPRRAAGDLFVQRAVGWSLTVLYFLGTAVPKAGSLLPEVAANVFGTRP